MSEEFKIYVDRLRNGEVEAIKERVSPDFLEQSDEELSFDMPVAFNGEAYLAEDELILHLNIETVAKLPCSICQKRVEVPLTISDFYHAEPLSELKDAIFDFQGPLRETVILNAPQLVECSGGKCPERENIKQYLNKNSGDGHQPFAGINFNNQ